MKRILSAFLFLGLVGQGVIPASLLPKPICNYEERSVEVYSVEGKDGELYFIMDKDNIEKLANNFNDIRQCVTDLEIWAIQVERLHK